MATIKIMNFKIRNTYVNGEKHPRFPTLLPIFNFKDVLLTCSGSPIQSSLFQGSLALVISYLGGNFKGLIPLALPGLVLTMFRIL